MSFLIPIGVVCYAAIGGLKATFTTSYMHTVIIYIVCLVLMFKVGAMTVLVSGANTLPGVPTKPFTYCQTPFHIIYLKLFGRRQQELTHLPVSVLKACGCLQVFLPGNLLGGIDQVLPEGCMLCTLILILDVCVACMQLKAPLEEA